MPVSTNVLSDLEYGLLKTFFPRSTAVPVNAPVGVQSRLRLLFPDHLLASLRGKTVVDFGCGEGNEAVDLANLGAARVIGIDIREDLLRTAEARASAAGTRDVCEFTTSVDNIVADAIVSVDAFEHFEDPEAVLNLMHTLLKPGGQVLISFGPTWLHPLGGHLFSVFPWAHLLLTEKALIRWRSDFKSDGATRFHEVAGGLNQMTIRRFEKLVRASAFQVLGLEPVPIRRLRFLHNRWTAEFTTALVRCRLLKA